MADLRQQLEKNMLVHARAADRDHGQAPGHRHRAQGLLRRAQGRIRHHAADHARARSWSPCRSTARASTWRQDDDGQGEGGGRPREGRGGRAVRAAGGRLFRLGVEGQRRPRRPARARAICREELQKAIAGLKTGAITPVTAHDARLPDHQDRKRCSDTTTKPFEEAKDEIADKIANEKRQGEYAKFIEKPARRSDHRLEERRDQEGLRDRPEAASRVGAVSGP